MVFFSTLLDLGRSKALLPRHRFSRRLINYLLVKHVPKQEKRIGLHNEYLGRFFGIGVVMPMHTGVGYDADVALFPIVTNFVMNIATPQVIPRFLPFGCSRNTRYPQGSHPD